MITYQSRARSEWESIRLRFSNRASDEGGGLCGIPKSSTLLHRPNQHG